MFIILFHFIYVHELIKGIIFFIDTISIKILNKISIHTTKLYFRCFGLYGLFDIIML